MKPDAAELKTFAAASVCARRSAAEAARSRKSVAATQKVDTSQTFGALTAASVRRLHRKPDALRHGKRRHIRPGQRSRDHRSSLSVWSCGFLLGLPLQRGFLLLNLLLLSDLHHGELLRRGVGGFYATAPGCEQKNLLELPEDTTSLSGTKQVQMSPGSRGSSISQLYRVVTECAGHGVTLEFSATRRGQRSTPGQDPLLLVCI